MDVPIDDAVHDYLFCCHLFLTRVFVAMGAIIGDHRRGCGVDPSHSALHILNERYARGEIQKDEYAEKKAAILSGGPR